MDLLYVIVSVTGDGKFRYLKGIEHKYDYSVAVRTLFNGTSKNESTLFIHAEAEIDFVSECDGLLTLIDVRLSENDSPKSADDTDYAYVDEDESQPNHKNNAAFAEALQEYSLRFAFQDGVISEVCPDSAEKSWVLNFKKGLLSMLHNTMRRFDLDHRGVEHDVHGRCDATYKVLEPNGTSLVIEKTRDLTSCESRSKLHSVVQSTSYNFRPVCRKLVGMILYLRSYIANGYLHRLASPAICTNVHYEMLKKSIL